MKKILFIDSNHPRLHEKLQSAGFSCDLYFDKSPDELIHLLPQYDACVIRSKFKITRDIIDSCPNLKAIARAGAGMENIDVEYATKKGILCIHAPEGNKDAVAEHAIGMLLALFNNIVRADREVRNGIWKREENRGIELMGKTVGVIGYGNMGSALCERLKGFGVRILVYDKYKTGFGSEFIQECSLIELQKESDIISLHVPYTNETHHLVNSEFIQSVNKPFYLINTARGKCVNTIDLVEAIKNGKIKGACLDVLEYESVSFENIAIHKIPAPLSFLFQSEKVILSPHIAGWTQESNVKIAEILSDKLIAALS